MDEKTIRVDMFGGFTISNADGSAEVSDRSNRSKKVLTLIEYLVTFHTREVSQDELIELLWPEGYSNEPANTLKTLLHRARTTLDELGPGIGKKVISSRRGTCCWNSEYQLKIDTERFEACCVQANELESEEKLKILLEAIDIYKGEFLPKSSSDLWAMPITTYYHNLYLGAVHKAIEMLTERARLDEVIEICQRAISIDQFDEQLHLAMIQALVANGMQQQAMNHYNQVTEMLLDKFGVTPSPELTALYKEIIKTSKSTEMNLNIICEELRETEWQKGAFFCEYEVFKDVYRLRARSAGRYGDVTQIALITVMEMAGHKLNQKQMAVTMERLKECIRISLRTSDVFSRFSVSQFLIMLPSASVENSEMALQRINSNFRKAYPHMNLLFHYSSMPMELN